MKRTAGVEALVNEVLQTIPNRPRNITDLVFMAIERDETRWLVEYNYLVSTLTERVVNAWVGRYVSQIAGLEASGAKGKAQSALIKSGEYSELTPPEH
jgi:hypothetical protein